VNLGVWRELWRLTGFAVIFYACCTFVLT